MAGLLHDLERTALRHGLLERSAQDHGSLPAPDDTAGAARWLALQGRFPVEALYRALAQDLGLDYVDIEHTRPRLDLLPSLPRALDRRGSLLPCDDPGGLVLATCEPQDRAVVDAARRALGAQCTVKVLEPEVLQRLARGDAHAEAEPLDAPALLDRLLLEAYLRRSSDIHLEPHPDGLRVRMRTDGCLQSAFAGHSRAAGLALTTRIKVLAGLDITEQRTPQDGSFRIPIRFVPGASVEIRVASLPVEEGERVTLRLLAADPSVARLEALGLDEEGLACLRRSVRRSAGLILIAGPTGSGKTTTLYAALEELDRTRRNVLAVEDPIERRLSGVTQVRVGTREKIGFAAALRAFLRHDPDVILVGEIRDSETADAAVRAAMTGHLVLSTVHTGTAAGAVERLRDLGVEPYRIGSVLRLVLAQRLVRRVCPRCTLRADAPPEAIEWIGAEHSIAVPRGCPLCVGTGYRGRIGLFESLEVTPDLATAIAAGRRDLEPLAESADVLRRLRTDLLAKVRSGATTWDEARIALAEIA